MVPAITKAKSALTEPLEENKLRAFVRSTDGARWKMFEFPVDDEGIGDAAGLPFVDKVEYKVNAVNYNLYSGDRFKFSFSCTSRI